MIVHFEFDFNLWSPPKHLKNWWKRHYRDPQSNERDPFRWSPMHLDVPPGHCSTQRKSKLTHYPDA